MRSFLFVVGAICLFACKTTKAVVNEDRHKTPPNGVLLDSRLWCDKTEVSTIAIKEYRFWVRRVFGPGSEEFKLSEPTKFRPPNDTSRGLSEPPRESAWLALYWTWPEFDDMPAIGITRDQALAYSKWRTDRVFEATLIEQGIIPPYIEQTPENHFTVERYLNGEYRGYVPDGRVTHVFMYDLPTDEERKKCLEYLDSTYIIKGQAGSESWITLETTDVNASVFGTPVSPVTGAGNEGAIHHLKGNVAEWGKEPGVVYGGSWKQNRKQVEMIDKMGVGLEPKPWIGFRNICRKVPVEEYLKMVENKEAYE
jgi:hypothetical protein